VADLIAREGHVSNSSSSSNGAGSIAGRSYIVTGGGTGIGAGCAAELVVQGAKVTICGRTESKLQAVADDLADRVGPEGAINVVVADVTVEDDVARLVAGALESGGGLHGVVANAGGAGGLAPYHRQDIAEFQRVLTLNVVGTLLMIKHSVAALAASGHGSFVGMSSIAGHMTHPYFGAYTVSKAGIEQLVRNAADEYGSAKVRFNAVRPGFIATEMMELIPRDSDIYKSYIDNTPLADVGEPADVAHLVRFLLSDEARWITGQCINVDGGHNLRRGPDFSVFAGDMSFDEA
jgi:NAD(P)-dependent dehydrogenase (short-subunit alcohol dehydrogenase family)